MDWREMNGDSCSFPPIPNLAFAKVANFAWACWETWPSWRMMRWQDAGRHVSGTIKQESVVRDPGAVDTPKVANFARSPSQTWPSWRCMRYACVQKRGLKLALLASLEGKTSKRGHLGFGYHRKSLILIFAKTSCEAFLYAMELEAQSLSHASTQELGIPQCAQGGQVSVAALGALAMLAADW